MVLVYEFRTEWRPMLRAGVLVMEGWWRSFQPDISQRIHSGAPILSLSTQRRRVGRYRDIQIWSKYKKEPDGAIAGANDLVGTLTDSRL